MVTDTRRPPQREGYCRECREHPLVGSYLHGFCSACLQSMTLAGVDRARVMLDRQVDGRQREERAR